MHREELPCLAGGHVWSLEGDPLWPRVATGGRARQLCVRHGGDVDSLLPGFTGSSLQLSLLIIRYEQKTAIILVNSLLDEEI